MIEPIRLLKEVFPGIDDDVLAQAIHDARQVSYPSGTVLCREGAEESIFYLLADGQAEVTKRFGGDQEYVLRTYSPGDFFGEMALITNSTRNVTVRAIEPVSVVEIDKSLFAELMRHSPAAVLIMFRESVELMRANDQTLISELDVQKQAVERAYDTLKVEERRRTDFLTSLSHELRTPLTSASGFMQLIKSGNVSGPILAMALDKISGGLEQIVSLVNDLLFVQEMDLIAPAIKPVNLSATIQHVVEECADNADDNDVHILSEIPADLPVLQADPDGLVRALRALLDNAIKFSPEGGDVRIDVSLEADRINIAISDPGIGIEADYLPRIFQRFEHRDSYGDHLFGGIGLGLPIAKHLIESFGGSISVQSEPGQGSVFTVHLPVLVGQPEVSG